jgi:hypothetical protein
VFFYSKRHYIIAAALVLLIVAGLALDRAFPMPRTVETTTPATIPAVTKDSLPFIMGAPLGENDSGAWQMMGLAFGPLMPDYKCELTFSDLQREQAETEWRNKHPRASSLPPELMKHTEVVLHLLKPSPYPIFKWFPDNPDHQHYSVKINCPNGSYDEDWEVGRILGQLRTKIAIAKIYPFGEPPEQIYSCVDHVSGRVDASTVLQPQDRYVANSDWRPRHRPDEFPLAIIPIRNNPGGYVYAMKVDHPGCWECLQKECGRL